MTITAYDRKTSAPWDRYDFNFNTFKSSEDFLQEVQDVNLSKDISFRERTDYEKFFVRKGYRNILNYVDFNKLESMLQDFDELYDQIDMGGAFSKNKLIITDDKRGIFSFSLASKGLYRGVEYFSEEIKIDNPIELIKYNKSIGVVPANLVENIYISGQKQFQYTSSSTKKTYQLTRQQEGMSSVISANPNSIIKETSGGLKYPEPQSFGDASVKFKTSTKKSYLMFDKKGGKAKMVELFIPVNLGFTLKHTLPVFLIAKYLISVGIKVKINAIRVYHENNYYYFMWSIPIKDYGDEMDFNKMALIGLDRRWWEMIKVGIQSIEQNKGNSIYNAQGGPAKNQADNIDTFSRYRNWYEEQIKLGNVEPLKVDKKLLIFAGLSEVSYDNDIYKEQVMNEFYRVMDRIDFFFNKTDKVVERIYKRVVEKKADKSFMDEIQAGIDYQLALDNNQIYKEQLISEMKIYVQQILSDTYTYPKAGQYAESKESAEMMEDEFDKKLEEMNKYLKTL